MTYSDTEPRGTLKYRLLSVPLLCSKFFLSHNSEPDAVDLLEELEMIEKLEELLKNKK